MASRCFIVSCAFLLLLIAFPSKINAEIPDRVLEKIRAVNAKGSHYGVVVPGQSVFKPFLQLFKADDEISTVQISGRTFHVGSISGRRVILVMSGDGMLNSAQTTKLLLNLFRMRSVIHYGEAGSGNPKELTVGDLSIPTQVAHCGEWHWARYGGDNSDYDREIAQLKFSVYTVPKIKANNWLDSVYFQPGEPKIGTKKFFLRVDNDLYRSAQKMAERVVLDQCTKQSQSAVCLSEKPQVKPGVGIGCSSDIYVNNVAYRDFLRSNLNASSIDKESAAVAWVCFGEKMPFIAMKSITDLGGSPPKENDLNAMQQLLPQHILLAMKEYFKQLPREEYELYSVV